MQKLANLSLFTIVIAVLISLVVTPAQAQDDQQDNIGLGVLLGDPSGISYKNYFNPRNAVDAAIGWSFRHHGGLYVHTDYLWHNYNLFQDIDEDLTVNRGLVAFYFGVGGRVFIGNDSNLGVRIPVGINYHFENDPLEIFFEIAPTLDLLPDTEADFSGGIGIRYYF